MTLYGEALRGGDVPDDLDQVTPERGVHLRTLTPALYKAELNGGKAKPAEEKLKFMNVGRCVRAQAQAAVVLVLRAGPPRPRGRTGTLTALSRITV